MGPTNQPTTAGTQPVPFTDAHNAAYNSLRNTMLHYHAAGVPGMDTVLNNLNKTHTQMAQNYTPTPPVAPARPVAPVAPVAPTAPQASGGLQQLNQMMQGIRQGAMSQLPYGYQGY